ncbi:hypothetical protein PHK61_26175 [Actinomycetospora lutea]|uniref:hypothetical protein n=1 Tax=Actinomycetospora lutea TaxID=663604 RepID=UPI0023663258|nr:hypothetical protein [Actinomycetospora lutea]MDD7941906.1 hypothetical protein [Actinomycetospora lutea]
MEGDGGVALPGGAGRAGRRDRARRGGRGRAGEQAGPGADGVPDASARGAGERAVGAGEAAGDEHGDRQVRGEHPRAVGVRGRVPGVVVVGARRQCEVQGDLAGGEDRGEERGGAGSRPDHRRGDGDHDAHGERPRGGRDGAAGLPVRGDAEDRGAGTEQHGTRRRRSVGGHGPPR